MVLCHSFTIIFTMAPSTTSYFMDIRRVKEVIWKLTHNILIMLSSDQKLYLKSFISAQQR